MAHILRISIANLATSPTLTGTTIPTGIRMYPIPIGTMYLGVVEHSLTGWELSYLVLVRDLKILCLKTHLLQTKEAITSSAKIMYQPLHRTQEM